MAAHSVSSGSAFSKASACSNLCIGHHCTVWWKVIGRQLARSFYWGLGRCISGYLGVWFIACDTGRVLIDAEMDAPVVAEIQEVIKASEVEAEITDLLVWRVVGGKYACIVCLLTASNISPEYFREQLSIHDELVHVTVEINRLVI